MRSTSDKKRILTMGSAVCDIMMSLPAMDVSSQGLDDKMIGFSYGAKYRIDNISVGSGGGGCNTAVNFARLGCEVAVCAAIGDDMHADFIFDNLRAFSIETKFLRRYDNIATSIASIMTIPVDNDMEHIIFHYGGAGDRLQITYDEIDSWRPEIIYSCSMGAFWKKNIQSVLEYKKKYDSVIFAWNPGLGQLTDGHSMKRFLRCADILIVNKKEAMVLLFGLGHEKSYLESLKTSSLAEILGREFSAIGVVLTDGANGAYSIFDGASYHEPIYLGLKTVDTTGVGDAFGSTFVFSYGLFNGDVQKSLRYAAINAAHVSAVPGAQRGALAFSQIEEIANKKIV